MMNKKDGTHMGLRIFNSLTKRKDEFQPEKQGRVSMYVCGVTVYDLCHVGHARSMVVFDVIYRYLTYLGYTVDYVRNYTDIDDKIINRAIAEEKSCQEISERYIKETLHDVETLGLEKPTHEPKATDHIKDIIELISMLIERRHAYAIDGNVYFAVETLNDYGKLSGRNKEELIAGTRVEVDSKKRNPLDFALWKKSKPGEPRWSSPWGDGRPGWHIECSAMSMKYLGETLDIHGGGLDLVFPHHENEIAQSEAATGKQFVKYWIHNGFVTVDEEKMSKSLGNFFTIREILRHHHTDVLRMLFLTNHYRTPVDFSPQNLKEAKGTIDRLYRLFYDINEIEKDSASRGKAKKRLDDLEKISKKVKSFKERFISAMDDDFNTAAALGYTHDLVRDLNRLISHSEKSGLDHDSYDTLIEGSSVLQEMVGLLGLLHTEPSMYFEEDKKRKLSELNLHEEDILKLIAERDEARKAKNWERADKIRDTLKNMGITLQDSQKGTTFSFIDRG